jgi:hypothetical protein
MGKGGPALDDVKQVTVKFGSGQEVLSAYWGFLSDGGLVIPDQEDLNEGQLVRLRIRIDSSGADYDLGGRVVRRHSADHQVIVAFDHGEPHDMLLTAALSETDDVPARRFQRYAVSVPVEVGDAQAQLVDVSAGGCCLRLPAPQAEALPVGADVMVSTQEFEARGTVVWVHGLDRGVSFDESGTWAATQYIESLRSS